MLILALLVLLAGAAYVGYKVVKKSQRTSVSSLPTVSPQPTETNNAPTRSKAPGVITKVEIAKALSKTGEAVNPTTTFSKTDPALYAVLSLLNPKVGTKFEYVRYLNDKFLDNGSLTLKVATSNNASFKWSLKKRGAVHPVGSYRIKVYTNGVFEREASYTVK